MGLITKYRKNTETFGRNYKTHTFFLFQEQIGTDVSYSAVLKHVLEASSLGSTCFLLNQKKHSLINDSSPMDRSLKNMLSHILLTIENEEFEENEILERGEVMKDSN